jgi:hypothetical protein
MKGATLVKILGAILFGLVIGWVTYRTLRRSTEQVGLSDIASVIGAVGGATVTKLYDDAEMFGWYSIGLASGFFGYFVTALSLEGKNVSGWMGVQGDPPGQRTWGRPC